ncbi:hypothetical protein B5807_00253 [Epicoccum nigrum]|uniref:Uncharacterized protein n=1 Tax=Epicoccum nigrum TaxID=105696 RepID=A0A1Y2MFG3_EPING|nr:hypothetical protein B5807_00253 [Epicoccum nigrum]
MAPINPESLHPQPHRRNYISTSSPSELFDQIISTLGRQNNIDAPIILELRQLISETIHEPRTPPALRRTRPDRRLGELISLHETKHRPMYEVDGPPVSAERRFYFHHTNPDFKKVLPQVDLSRYPRKGGLVSQSESHGEKIPGSQESVKPGLTIYSASVVAQRSASTQASTSQTPERGECNKKCETEGQRLEETHASQKKELPNNSGSPMTTASAQNIAPNEKLQTSVPVNTVTCPESEAKTTRGQYTPLSPQGGVSDRTPFSRDIENGIPESDFTSSSHILPLADTQDTCDSTQQSEVFSQPADIEHFTPPTQESTGDFFSQIDTVDLNDGVDKYMAETSQVSHDSTVDLGKRLRDVRDTGAGAQGVKRSKSVHWLL